MARIPDDLQAIVAQAGDIRRRLLVLDFDGTLSPIVEHPDDAALFEGAHDALKAVAEQTSVVVLSGRPVDDLLPRLAGLPVTLVGGHGSEVRLDDGHRLALIDLDATTHTLDVLEDELGAMLDRDDGWVFERKAASLAVHHRQVVLELVRERLDEVRATMRAHEDDAPGWEILEGKAVIELRPQGVNKGTALAWLEQHFPGRRPLVLGDDVTDEDSFRAAQAMGGDGVLVSERMRPTTARWRLDGPPRVVALLRALRWPDRAGVVPTRSGTDVRFQPIREYGMIGDSRTAALVSPDGSLDWMCVPRFDSPSVFAALLDPVHGGRFRIRPVEQLDVAQSYVGDTNVLVTRFLHEGEPVLTLTDFLVFSRVNAFDTSHTGHMLLRRIEAAADADVEIEFQPRFDYGRALTRITQTAAGLHARAGSEHVELLTDDLEFTVSAHEDGNGDVGRCKARLAAGERRWLQLHSRGAEHGPHLHLTEDELLELTVRAWGRWTRLIDYHGPWREDVIRSALVLKGLVYEPTGALVAAPTTSLPEHIGGERNWDYRFAWIRDSAYVLECFLRIGHTREAETFIRWLSELTQRIGGAHSLRPLYRITGEEDLAEFELPHFEGYLGSRPVRVGNAAASQLQLDIYGAAMELGYLTEQIGDEVPAAQWPVIRELVETVAQRWREPDAGLWEIRSDLRHHTFSKFQCWLSIDRAIRIGRDLGLRGPYDRWAAVADDIRDSILTHGYDEQLASFVQAYGEKDLDAALLMLPLRGFIPASDPRVRSTVAAIRRELEVADGLLLRYKNPDGLEGADGGAFLMCSFWLVEVLARMGDLDEAVRLFERLRTLAGPLGMYAEEIDPRTHEHLGNYPQGFTHMALITAATAIDEELRSQSRSVRSILRGEDARTPRR